MRVAYKMKLNPGQEEEYKRRHDALWPELKELLGASGIHDYGIFLDEQTHLLFAVLKVEDTKSMEGLSLHPVMKKWWNYMKDIMETNPDHSPVSTPLKEVFYLP